MAESENYSSVGLPRDLGDGLTLRWATPDDTEAVAEHNAVQLNHGSPEPNEGARGWVREMMRGEHPTMSAGDFIVIVDENAGGKIVSSMCLIQQTWAYAGIPFKVGRPELVSTDPAYRRRGLVRAQFDAIHARSASRGELLQGITGIAWYYRQFGYEMTITNGGSKRWLWFRIPPRKPGEQPAYKLRLAVAGDFELIDKLYKVHCSHMLVTRLRDQAEWLYELAWKKFWIVEDSNGDGVGYAEARVDDGGDDPELVNSLKVLELAAMPGHSLQAVSIFLGQEFQKQIDELNKTREKPLTGLAFDLGPDHPVYAVLGDLLEQYRPTWTWYIRVPDIPAFLRLITPALEARLAASPLSGHTGTLRLNLYRSQIALNFQDGKLIEVGTYTRSDLEDGDASFPELTFLHLLFGQRTVAELNYIYPDCYADGAAGALLSILFPRQASNPVWLS